MPVPEFKSTVKISRTNLAKFGSPLTTTNKTNKSFSNAQQSKDLELGNNGLMVGNSSGTRLRPNNSFNESLISNHSIFRDNSRGLSPQSQLGLSIVGNKHLDARNQESSPGKATSNPFITESRQDLDNSVRNGTQAMINRANLFFRPPEEISFNAAFPNSIKNREPRQIDENNSFSQPKKENFHAITEQAIPQIRIARASQTSLTFRGDTTPNGQSEISQKTLNRTNSLGRSFVFHNPSTSEFAVTQSQVKERADSLTPISEKNLSPTKRESDNKSGFGDSIDNFILSMNASQMPGDLLSRFTTAKTVGENHLGGKRDNERLNKMQKELADTLDAVNQRKQRRRKSDSDQMLAQDTRPTEQVTSEIEGKIEDVVAAKIEIDEVLKKNTLDPEVEKEIDSVLKKYSLERSFWNNYLENKRMMLSNSEMFSGASSDNAEIDVALEIKKFKKEYKY